MLVLESRLHWLARHFKAFVVPPVLVAETPLAAEAVYEWNVGAVVMLDGNEVWNEAGLIVISASTTLSIEATILHEYRHHLQFWLSGRWPVPDYAGGASLRDYNECPQERDARLFEVALTGARDAFTDYYNTPRMGRSTMLSLPTAAFLRGLGEKKK